MSNSNLKPLQADIHRTGKWNFSGKNLPPDEVQALANKGVDWEVDVMPDGRLKLPKFRKSWRKTTVVQATETDEQFDKKWDEWRSEWEQLSPETRPRFGTWLIDTKEDALVKPLFRVLTDSGRKAEVVRTANTLWEHFKTKPKTQLEVSEVATDPAQIPVEAMLQNLLEYMDISYDKFQRFLATEDAEVTTQ